jgi:hypothetical protein
VDFVLRCSAIVHLGKLHLLSRRDSLVFLGGVISFRTHMFLRERNCSINSTTFR